MDSLRWTVLVPLAFLVLLLHSTTPSVAHDLPSVDSAPLIRVSRNTPVQSREDVAASSQVLQSSLALIGNVIGDLDPKKVSSMMKSLQNVASLAPVIGGLVSSFVNVALAFVPQDNHLKELRDKFSELDRKLDSLSIQTSNQLVNAEWFSYISIYSRDEVAVLNAWKKFNELREGSELGRSQEEKLQLAEVFTTYYQNSGAADTVLNFYHYLTDRRMSLSGNVDQMLKTKFNCDVNQMLRYHLHFSGLLWRGMLLQQLYQRLTGFSSPVREAEHVQMFQKVLEVQRSSVDFCLNNYEQYMRDDVLEITKKLSPGKEEDIAVQVKEHLDRKYIWNNWVVYVLRTHWEDIHSFPNMMLIQVGEFHPGIGKLTVAIGYTQREDAEREAAVRKELQSCYEKSTKPPPRKDSDIVDSTLCEDIAREIPRCNRLVDGIPVRDLVKVMVFGSASQRKYPEVGEAPEPLELLDCLMDRLPGKLSIHFSRNLTVCQAGWCLNGAPCWKMLDSNQQLCECPQGYYGDRCQHEMKTTPVLDVGYTIPDITTINAKLKLMEAKLEEILRTISTKCPSQ